jgi:hypothetical protein
MQAERIAERRLSRAPPRLVTAYGVDADRAGLRHEVAKDGIGRAASQDQPAALRRQRRDVAAGIGLLPRELRSCHCSPVPNASCTKRQNIFASSPC